jgi:hypothetical protein
MWSAFILSTIAFEKYLSLQGIVYYTQVQINNANYEYGLYGGLIGLLQLYSL